MLYNAAARVVHSRAPESTKLQEREQFGIAIHGTEDCVDPPPVSDEKVATESGWQFPAEKGYPLETNFLPAKRSYLCSGQFSFQAKQELMVDPLQGRTLLVFGSTNPIRIGAWKVARSKCVNLISSLSYMLLPKKCY